MLWPPLRMVVELMRVMVKEDEASELFALDSVENYDQRRSFLSTRK